jgi:glucuronokinase
MDSLETFAHARVGLLGNPSDIYGGKGVGFAVRQLKASVRLTPGEPTPLEGQLLQAGWRVAESALREAGAHVEGQPFRLEVETNIPLQSGLSGSSAILTAAFRAWQRWFEVSWSRARLAQLVLATEVEELGIRAGALDRLVQSYEGLVAMDFSRPFAPDATQRLDPGLLPELLIVWNPERGESSGQVHESIWERFQAGDPAIHSVVEELAELADQGRRALLARDLGHLRRLIDRNFDLRAQLFEIEPSDLRMIEIGRDLGAATKFCGSGGSVLALPDRPERMAELRSAYEDRGLKTLIPGVIEPQP